LKQQIKVAALKGPTAIGMVQLMENAKEQTAKNDYEFQMWFPLYFHCLPLLSADSAHFFYRMPPVLTVYRSGMVLYNLILHKKYAKVGMKTSKGEQTFLIHFCFFQSYWRNAP